MCAVLQHRHPRHPQPGPGRAQAGNNQRCPHSDNTKPDMQMCFMMVDIKVAKYSL